MEQKRLEILDDDFQRELFGNFDQNIKKIEEALGVHVVLRDGHIVMIGQEEKLQRAEDLMKELHKVVKSGKNLDLQNVGYSIELLDKGEETQLTALSDDIIALNTRGNPIMPKTLGQKEYIKLMKENDITFCVGPAGTGKTYLAVAMAVKAFKRDEVSRIILTRPAVEAGESLGFLPGDLKDKVDPYLRPLYDALFDIMGGKNLQNIWNEEL